MEDKLRGGTGTKDRQGWTRASSHSYCTINGIDIFKDTFTIRFQNMFMHFGLNKTRRAAAPVRQTQSVSVSLSLVRDIISILNSAVLLLIESMLD